MLAAATTAPAATARSTQRPSALAIPATALFDRESIEIRVEGFGRNTYFNVTQCVGDTSDFTRCSNNSSYAYTDERGSARTSLVVRRTLHLGGSTTDCATTQCTVVLQRERFRKVLPLSFDRGAPAVMSGLPPQPSCVAWPTNGWPTGPIPEGVDAAAVAQEGDRMIASGATSIVVVHGGKVVYENYATGHGPNVIEASFSMSKSFTSTVVGLLAQQGKLALDSPAPVAEWSDPSDPRHAITLRNILNMSSGLQWNEIYSDIPGSDVMQMILREPDQAGYVIAKPLANKPGTVWNYSTGDTAILGRIIGNTANVSGTSYEQYLHDVLFDPLGMDPVVPAFDATGTWDAGWFTNMSTRNFAKLGYLYLRNGVWENKQFLSPSWVDFVRTPSPASSGYGGQFWLQSDGSFEMIGLYGQTVHIVPASDLIVAWSNGYGSGTMESLFSKAVRPACGSTLPLLKNDSARTQRGQAIDIAVLRNDKGGTVGLAPGTLTVSALATHGTATPSRGRIRYVPKSDFRGTDHVRYVVCTRDRTACYEATVSIDVR